MPTLTQDEHELLHHAVAEHNSDLLPLLSEIGRRPLSSDEREELRGALAEELTESGLGPGDEPTDYGRRLDDLIGRLGALREV
jgi:hypothetical protein